MLKFISLLLFLGCTQIASVNMKKHDFSSDPRKIIWLQIAGLNEEHLAMLKFKALTSSYKTTFENSLCFGKTWDFNLYDLRPSSEAGFLSQITGSKNIKNNCEDYKMKPLWGYFKEGANYTGVFEINPKHRSILESKKCSHDFMKDVSYSKFDTNNKTSFQTNQVENLASTLHSAYQKFSNEVGRHVFLIRDFSYEDALINKDIRLASLILEQLEKFFIEIEKEYRLRNDALYIISSSSSYGIEFPSQGKEWRGFEKTGENIFYKKRSLMSPIFASGARSENFCGVYDQSEILERILGDKEKLGLEFKLVNPFN